MTKVEKAKKTPVINPQPSTAQGQDDVQIVHGFLLLLPGTGGVGVSRVVGEIPWRST